VLSLSLLLQIGKSGASWVTQAFLLGCGSIAAAMPFTGVIFAGVIITWINVSLQVTVRPGYWGAHRVKTVV
jgi:ATP/ADP translocase